MKRLMILILVLFGVQLDVAAAARHNKKRTREDEEPATVAAVASAFFISDDDTGMSCVVQEITTPMLIEALRAVEDGDKERRELIARLTYPCNGTILHVIATTNCSAKLAVIIRTALVKAAIDNELYVPTAVNAYLAITDTMYDFRSGETSNKTAYERALEYKPGNAELIALLSPLRV